MEEAKALLTLRDERLYHRTHETFEQYVEQRWGIERAHAYRVCGWAGEVAAVSPIFARFRANTHARVTARYRRPRGRRDRARHRPPCHVSHPFGRPVHPNLLPPPTGLVADCYSGSGHHPLGGEGCGGGGGGCATW